MEKERVTSEEILDLLKKVISGELEIIAIEKDYTFPFNDLFKGRVNGMTITFFFDTGELDYVDEVFTDDGRYTDGGYWSDLTTDEEDPIEYLSDEEIEILTEQILKASKKLWDEEKGKS